MRFLDLGMQPLANAFLRAETEIAAEARYPLALHGCETCGLVQLVDVIDPEILFRNYIYVTGTSETIAAHNRSYARTVADLLQLTPGCLVVEAASNDGSLLACFKDLGVRVLGVEPAENIAALAAARGIRTEVAFFDREAGPRPDHTALDVLLPHPVYARQRWISILDPSAATFHSVVLPLIALAHDRLAAQRARHASPSR